MDASDRISQEIADHPDWQGEWLRRIRALVLSVDPEIGEEWKWNTPVWSLNGIVCAAGLFKTHVKVNFFRGAELDGVGLFNAGLDAKVTRAIDLQEGDKLDEAEFVSLVKSAVALNRSKAK